MRAIAWMFWSSLVFVILAVPAQAHHSAAPHYDLSSRVEITGKIERFEARNPHSFIYIRAADNTLYKCEFNAIANLVRVGITVQSFPVGEQISVTANPHRRVANECLYISGRLSNNRVITGNVTPPPAATPTAGDETIFGVWVRGADAAPAAARGNTDAPAPPPPGRGARGPQGVGVVQNNMLSFLTDEGRRGHAGYDPIRDDPARQCSPVGPIRLWGTPNTPFEIRKEGDKITLRYEFMDAVRVIDLKATTHPGVGTRSVLGHSIGHWEGDTLVVDTAFFAPGVILQYGQDQTTGAVAGVLHSDAYRLTERMRVDSATGSLMVSWTQADPKYFTRSFDAPPRAFVRRPDLKIGRYNCQKDTGPL